MDQIVLKVQQESIFKTILLLLVFWKFIVNVISLPANVQVLGVLSQDGIMRFINIQTFKLLFEIGSVDNAVTTVTMCPKGRHVVAVMDSGALNIYSVQGLSQEVNKVDWMDVSHISLTFITV